MKGPVYSVFEACFQAPTRSVVRRNKESKMDSTPTRNKKHEPADGVSLMEKVEAAQKIVPIVVGLVKGEIRSIDDRQEIAAGHWM
jgi:hypothetical protein